MSMPFAYTGFTVLSWYLKILISLHLKHGSFWPSADIKHVPNNLVDVSSLSFLRYLWLHLKIMPAHMKNTLNQFLTMPVVQHHLLLLKSSATN